MVRGPSQNLANQLVNSSDFRIDVLDVRKLRQTSTSTPSEQQLWNSCRVTAEKADKLMVRSRDSKHHLYPTTHASAILQFLLSRICFFLIISF